ncbi:cellulase family glycosylhydrolase [Gryllotalpicola koreensis]|uniref:Glycoside hydrolase family 5 domain-containing protein n=1 Tax=Gryllotalpicola koreensis TaxID=993086 RepID=A0ABP7ZQG2_9MICO
MAGLAAILTALVAGLILSALPAHAANTGFSVSGGHIYDANGNVFIPQGINDPYQWYPNETSSFADIRAAGANTVRVVLSGGRYGTTSATDVASVIASCKQNDLVCILEDHDTTGYGDDTSAYSLATAAQYWV